MLHFIELQPVSSETRQFLHKGTKGSVDNITKASNIIIITKKFKRTSQKTSKQSPILVDGDRTSRESKNNHNL